jgi:hypothetical protein
MTVGCVMLGFVARAAIFVGLLLIAVTSVTSPRISELVDAFVQSDTRDMQLSASSSWSWLPRASVPSTLLGFGWDACGALAMISVSLLVRKPA